MHHASADFQRVARSFLSGGQETYATVLLAVLLQVYGAECLDWDPMTIEAQITEDFGCRMPHVVFDQLMGLIVAMTTDTVYTSVATFDRTINALTRCGVDAEDDMPSVEELAWTVFELTINDPDPYGQTSEWPFSPQIALYCGVILTDAGLRRPPTSLEFAQMPRWAPKDVSEDPEMFAGAWDAQVSNSDDVDRHVQDQYLKLVSHLKQLGIAPAPFAQEQADQLPSNPLDEMLGR